MYENHTYFCMVIIHFSRKGCASTAPEQPPAPLAVEARPSLSKAGGSARTGQTLLLLSLSMGGYCLSVCPHWGDPLLFMFLLGPGHPETATQAGGSPQPAPHTCRAAGAYSPSSSSSFCSRASASNPAATIFPSGAMSNVWGMDLTPYTSPATHCQPFRSDR